MKLWQLMAAYVVTMLVLLFITFSMIISAVSKVENKGGLKSVTHDLWEGKTK